MLLKNLRNSLTFAIGVIVVGFIVFAYSASVNKVTDFVIFCIYVLGFDVLYGHMGRISFGHTLYLGTGAYGAAMCAKYLIPDPFLAIAVGVAAGAAVGLLLGPIAVKTTGAAFALINVAFNQIGYFIVLVALASYTGGEDGVSLDFNSYGFVNFRNVHFLFAFCLASPGGRLLPDAPALRVGLRGHAPGHQGKRDPGPIPRLQHTSLQAGRLRHLDLGIGLRRRALRHQLRVRQPELHRPRAERGGDLRGPHRRTRHGVRRRWSAARPTW